MYLNKIILFISLSKTCIQNETFSFLNRIYENESNLIHLVGDPSFKVGKGLSIIHERWEFSS